MALRCMQQESFHWTEDKSEVAECIERQSCYGATGMAWDRQ